MDQGSGLYSIRKALGYTPFVMQNSYTFLIQDSSNCIPGVIWVPLIGMVIAVSLCPITSISRRMPVISMNNEHERGIGTVRYDWILGKSTVRNRGTVRSSVPLYIRDIAADILGSNSPHVSGLERRDGLFRRSILR